MRRFDEAITAHEQDRHVYRETGDRHSEGQVSGTLGTAYAELDQLDLARHGWVSAVDLFVAVGDDERAALVRQRLADPDGEPSSGFDG